MNINNIKQAYLEYLKQFRLDQENKAIAKEAKPKTFAQFAPNVLPRKHKKEEI